MVVLLCGCVPLDNDQIIAETKKCEAAGMRAVLMQNAGTGVVVDVVCYPLLTLQKPCEEETDNE